MRIKIEYDSETLHMTAHEDAENMTELITGCVHVVGCMALLVKESYGEQAMEALLQSIRNVDDAGGYKLLSMIEDGDTDEEGAERLAEGMAGLGADPADGRD